jgi:dienelactone hydrolase
VSAPQPDPLRPATTGMPGRTPAQIRGDIDAQRQQLGTSVEQLRHRVTELTDWRRQVREHKNELAVGAAVVGFAIGGWIALRRRR